MTSDPVECGSDDGCGGRHVRFLEDRHTPARDELDVEFVDEITPPRRLVGVADPPVVGTADDDGAPGVGPVPVPVEVVQTLLDVLADPQTIRQRNAEPARDSQGMDLGTALEPQAWSANREQTPQTRPTLLL